MKVDLFDPEFLTDPYPTYEWLRDNEPVHHLGGNFYLVSRYDDIVRVLRDPQVFSSELGYGGMMTGMASGRTRMPGSDPARQRALSDSGMGMLAQGFAGMRVLIATDPPDHTRLRRLVSKPFAPRNIWEREERFRQVCDELVDEMLEAREDGVVDLWQHISFPLPTMVIAEMLGIPPERKRDFRRWSDAIVFGLSLGGNTTQADLAAGAGGVMEMFQYFREVIAERQADPQDDLISLIVTEGTEGEEPLTPEELIAFCVLLLIAGNETTTNLLGNFWEAMDRRPDVIERLREDPSLVKPAVEEALRFDPPVQGLWRGLRAPATVGDVELPEDARVMVLFASGNRDRGHYGPDADTFVVDRNPTDHVAFGTGIHVCLGAALARLEARVAIATLLERTTRIEKAGEPMRPLSPVLRGVRSQPVRVEAA